MATEVQKRAIKIAVVELNTPEELRAFFEGQVANATVVELPVEEGEEQPTRILPFRRREPPPKAA